MPRVLALNYSPLWKGGFGLALFLFLSQAVSGQTYPWLKGVPVKSSILTKISPPGGFLRTAVAEGSFQHWLRNLPLKKELKKRSLVKMEIGDVFIQGGFPGHAVTVVDMAENPKTGEKLFLLSQSYMPAQDMHILKNPGEPSLNPWYSLNFGEELATPEWTFAPGDLYRFLR